MAPKHLALALLLPLAVAGGVEEGPRSAPESCAEILEAEVCTWVVMEGGTVVQLGATIPLSVIEDVPGDAEMAWPPEPLVSVPLPDEARSALGTDHMVINWEAHGHPPMSFARPHFDFHFYTIAAEVVDRIDCTDSTKPAETPTGYVLPDIPVPGLGTLVGLCVPRMGMHAMPQGDLTTTAPFTASMIVGYYGGEPIFFEPMVARDRLLERRDIVLSSPPVDGLPPGVRYPSEVRAIYDGNADAYRIVMTGFEGTE